MYSLDYGEDSVVNIMYGVNSNKDYVPTKKEAADDEFDSSMCEHQTYWTFIFDGRRLRVRRQGTAG